MKKIVIFACLLISFSIQAQIFIKLDVPNLFNKSLRTEVEGKIKYIGVNFHTTLSKLNPVKNATTIVSYSPKIAYGGDIRAYIYQNDSYEGFAGFFTEKTTQKFEVINTHYKKNQEHSGILLGSRIKLRKRFFLELNLKISKNHSAFITDLDRNYIMVNRYYSFSGVDGGGSSGGSLAPSFSLNSSYSEKTTYILANLLITYKF